MCLFSAFVKPDIRFFFFMLAFSDDYTVMMKNVFMQGRESNTVDMIKLWQSQQTSYDNIIQNYFSLISLDWISQKEF